MITRKFLSLSYILLFALALFSCKSGDNINPFEDISEDELNGSGVEIQQEAIDDIVQNVSSPVEIAALIKSLDVPFSKKYLGSTDYLDKYNSSFSKAINLGVFGADLGYLNMYSKTKSSIEYLTTIKKLADGINVGQFFDFNMIKRLATNSENLDSLMYMSVKSFNQMDSYLRKNKRGNLSSLIITGVWIEGLYLATQVAIDTPHERMSETVGEQKMILNQLLLILNVYKNDPKIKDLITELQKIKRFYDEVTITIEVGDPVTEEVDGMLMIIQNEKSVVNISDETLHKIATKTEELRNKIIKS